MNYDHLLLPAGWAISKPYRATWIQAGKPTTHPMVRDFTNPHDTTVRVLPATLTVEALEQVQTTLANYDAPAAVLAAEKPAIVKDAHGTGWDFGNRNAFFDKRGCRCWILTTRDADGNQVGDADFCHARRDAMRWLRTGSLTDPAKVAEYLAAGLPTRPA